MNNTFSQTSPVLALGTDFDGTAIHLRCFAYGTREGAAGAPSVEEVLDACAQLRVEAEACLTRLRALTFTPRWRRAEVRTDRGTLVLVAGSDDEARAYVAAEIRRALRFLTDLTDVAAIVTSPEGDMLTRSAGLPS